MKHLVLISIILSSCNYEVLAQGSKHDYINVKSVNIAQGTHFRKELYSSSMQGWNGHPAAYNQIARVGRVNQHNIQSFVKKISGELLENLKYVSDETPLAVSSFVMLDGELMDSDIVGRQISESFIHEIYKAGIPVIDFKVTDYMRVTPDGDFILSRDFLELKDNLPIQYVLVGTLVRHRSGHIVNVRIVGIRSKAVVASAQGFIPEYITAGLIGENIRDGVRVF
ncbi:FlgO family outer membrane protein [Pseudoalteromonas denitrificans]|jgi:TolB-like protein|uniref:FlgO domain-containing protein n=1 Tax=Pseudoalteromonas denitrificans DSM 6059 TaxID=1123010 RepID=A0A1I1HQ73_9GAMM|nr:FlgO family outer membrane protein [Pseudoalteromonas denitrificans]SFC26021.1 hypothetical protein SAMN02745724_01293 [Pseudoalteromonas denitrificans DSM 6059]